MLASQIGRAAIVQALIGAGADLNLQNKDGETALTLASERDHPATVQALIEAGANLNLQAKVSGGLLLLELRHSSRCGSRDRWLNKAGFDLWGMVLSAANRAVFAL
jgi:ankyrin repeat protein